MKAKPTLTFRSHESADKAELSCFKTMLASWRKPLCLRSKCMCQTLIYLGSSEGLHVGLLPGFPASVTVAH